MKAHRLLLLIVFLTALTSLVTARPVRFVSYQELFDKSELVVIARPKATSDTKERIDLPGISVTNADNTSNGLPVIGIETKFHISVVLKGDRAIKDLCLHHYREAIKPERPVINGVMLVTFDPAKPGSFLLFLVKEPDGRYAPFDQTDPGLLSVQKVTDNEN